MRRLRDIVVKTALLALVLTVPALIFGWYVSGVSGVLGSAAGAVIALGIILSAAFVASKTTGERPGFSMALMLFSFLGRLLAVGLIFYLISKIPQINIFTAAVTLVVLYTVFAFSEFRFATIAQEPRPEDKTR